MRRPLLLVLCALSISPAAACGHAAGKAAASGDGVAWEPCSNVPVTDARCGRVSVLEDRRRPDARRIPLRLVVLPARNRTATRDAVFYLAGGPGQPATVILGDPSVVNGTLREHHDLVFVDQRGTGSSNGLECEFYGPPANIQSYFDKFLPLDKVRSLPDGALREG